MKTIRAWLIIRNGDDLRLAKRSPSLEANEVAVEIIVTAPSPPRIVGQVTVELPTAPPAFATAISIDYPDDEDTEEAHRQALREAAADE